MLQHNSAMNTSSPTLTIFYKIFLNFSPHSTILIGLSFLERYLALHMKFQLALNSKAAVFVLGGGDEEEEEKKKKSYLK